MAAKPELLITSNPPVVKKNPDGSEYIPIGHIEETLDKLYKDRWSTSDFRFHTFQVHGTTGSRTFVSGTVLLTVLPTGQQVGFVEDAIRREGSGTLEVLPTDTNTDYEATVLSYCVSNAAKRLGIVFGRALNNRLSVGENAKPLPVTQLREQERQLAEDDKMAKALNDAANEAMLAKSADEARKIIKKYGFSELNPKLKNIIATFKN